LAGSGRRVVQIAPCLDPLGNPTNPGRMQLKEPRKLLPFGIIAPAGDEPLDHGRLFNPQSDQPVPLYIRATALDEFDQQGNIVVAHIYGLRWQNNDFLQEILRLSGKT